MISIKGHNLLSYFLFSKKFRKCFILLPAFYLIMWLMKLPKFFEKMAILKIGELVFFWDVKTDFGKKKHHLPLKYWVIEAKVGFWIGYCTKHWSKYHLDTIQTRFSEKNNHLGTTMVKILFVHVWKCIILGVFHRSDFWHLRGKSALTLSKWLFFQSSLVISLAT